MKVSDTQKYMGDEVQVESDTAEIEDGDLVVDSARITFGDTENHFEFDEKVRFNEAIKEAMQKVMAELESERDGEEGFLHNGYDKPRIYKKESQKHQILQFVFDNNPTISKVVEEHIDSDYVSTIMSGMADNGVLEKVGVESRCNVYCITPLGMKELYALNEEVTIREPEDDEEENTTNISTDGSLF
jgi:predicted transcriptional regulator